MKYEIEIPDGVIPKGYEPIAFRRADGNEPLVSNAGPLAWGDMILADAPRLILRKIEPVKETRWANMYGAGPHEELILHHSRDAAFTAAATVRLDVLRIDYEDGVPVRTTLEGARL